MSASPLSARQLDRRVDPATLPFTSTADAAPPATMLGQDRALDALRFGARITAPGFNLFVIGAPSAGIDRTVRALLAEQDRGEPSPDDWVYVNNFAEGHRPRALRLPPRRGPEFRNAIAELIRRQKGGCAVVMGALSPRTRNAQVALYQNGDVDYLVATDAIGMGGIILNRLSSRSTFSLAWAGMFLALSCFSRAETSSSTPSMGMRWVCICS